MRPTLRTLVAVLIGCVFFGAPRRAHAAEEGALGFVAAFALAAGVGIGAVPLLVLREAEAPIKVGFGLGAGRRADAAALSLDVEGDLDVEGRFGWAARSRMDLGLESEDTFLIGSLRFDTLGSVVFVGEPRGPLALSALAGGVAWFSSEDRDGNHDIEGYAAGGPEVGLRVDLRSDYVRGRVEATYVPLFGEPPTGALHNLDVTSTVGITPWPEAPETVAFEAMLKREIGFGGPEIYGGTVVMLGVSISIDPTRAPPPPSPGFPAP